MSEQLNEGDKPESGTAPEEKVTFSEEQQKTVDKIAADGREKFQSERQKAADLQKQLDEANARIPKETRPEVPKSGDVFDDDHEERTAAREEGIRKQAKFDARQEFDTQAKKDKELADQQAEQARFNDSLRKFNDTAVKFDIDAATLDSFNATIASHGGLKYAVGTRVVGDEQGMLIYKHFAQNPDDIYRVNGMTEGDAAVFVSEIKSKATALFTKKASETPDPAETLTGAGVPPEKRGPKNATYE